jgi:hypothetical protein
MPGDDDVKSMESDLFDQLDTDGVETNPWEDVADSGIITNLGKALGLASNCKTAPAISKEMEIVSKGNDNDVEMSSLGKVACTATTSSGLPDQSPQRRTEVLAGQQDLITCMIRELTIAMAQSISPQI